MNSPALRMLMDAKGAAAALDISARTLWGLTARGEIPCVRIGRAVRYDVRDLEAFINRSKTDGAASSNFPPANAAASVPPNPEGT